MAKAPTKSPDAGGGSFGQVPQLNSGMLFSEVGSSGLRAFAGWVREEFLPELIGRQGARVYREMGDNSPIVGAVLFAVQGVLRKAEWRVEAANDTPEAQQMADFVEGLKDDMSAPWEDFVTEALSMLQYGYAPHEIVYKRRNGRKGFNSPTPSSRFDDGLIGWHKLPLRGQDTVLKWFFDPNGKVLGLTQQPWIGPLLDVPMEKMLLFRPTSHKGNPEGRPCTLDTKVPTPDGWTTMGAIQPGDRVYDEMGAIRRVVGKSEIFRDRPVYEIEFATGATVRADACHLWRVSDTNDRTHGKTRDVTTEQIAAWFDADGNACHRPGTSVERWLSRKAKNVSCGVAPILEGEDRALPLDPYVLGYWLGNGNAKSAQVTCHAEDADEIASLIAAAGFSTEVKNDWQNSGDVRHVGFYGSQKWAPDNAVTALRFLGVFNNKHVPSIYMTASPAQRLALLQGLMDSDGWSPTPSAKDRASTFANTNEAIISAVVELVRSLGGQPRVRTIDRIGEAGGVVNGRSIVSRSECYEVRFILDVPVHRLSRKSARQERKRTHRTAAHFIKSIRRVENADTVCIEVDSPSHLFLVGEAMVPTHNSILRNSYRPYFFIKRLEEQEAILFERMSGLPVMRVPNALLEAAASGDGTALTALTAYKKLVANVRIDEQMGLLIPSDTYAGANGPSNVPMYEFKLETPQSGKSALDANTPIERHKKDILTSILCDFIEMGHTSRGAQNLAETKVDLFMQASEGWLNSIAAVLNRHALPRLFALNGFDEDLMPEFVPDMAQRTDLDALSNFILRMSQAGMPLFPDADLESYVRDAAGLPDAADADSFGDEMREDAGPGDTQEDPQRAKLRRVVGNSVLRAIAARKRGR